jgi:hypothetical protein
VERQVLDELGEIDANALTPMQALQMLERWAAHLKEPKA